MGRILVNYLVIFCLLPLVLFSCSSGKSVLKNPSDIKPVSEKETENAAEDYFAMSMGNDYLLGPSDIIDISVSQDKSLSFSNVRISRKNTIKMGFIGKVKIGGLKVSEAEIELKKLLEKDYLQEADVAIVVREYNSQKIKIYGEVKAPGVYSLKTSTRILEALSLAGGRTLNASSRAYVIRNYRDLSPMVIIQNRFQKLKDDNLKSGAAKFTPEFIDIDLTALHKVKQDTVLKRGDFVFVPPMIHITIFGAVKREGTYSFSETRILFK